MALCVCKIWEAVFVLINQEQFLSPRVDGATTILIANQIGIPDWPGITTANHSPPRPSGQSQSVLLTEVICQNVELFPKQITVGKGNVTRKF